MDDQFKNCPFCGGTAEYHSCDDDGWLKTVVVTCSTCFAKVSTSVDLRPFSRSNDRDGFVKAVRKAAVDVWNRREEGR